MPQLPQLRGIAWAKSAAQTDKAVASASAAGTLVSAVCRFIGMTPWLQSILFPTRFRRRACFSNLGVADERGGLARVRVEDLDASPQMWFGPAADHGSQLDPVFCASDVLEGHVEEDGLSGL